MRDSHALDQVLLADGGASPLGHDRLVGLAVDHDLPAPFTDVPALRRLPDRKTPLLEQVNRGVHVARHVVDEVLAHDPHQVRANILDEIFRGVLTPAHAQVGVDRRQALRYSTAPLDGGLLDHDDLEVLAPVLRLIRGAAPGHAAADHEHVAVDNFSLNVHQFTLPTSAAARARSRPTARARPQATDS